eukprot:COSAG06_NODE_49923_length_322_cov_0.695067_1_plen_51_part_10
MCVPEPVLIKGESAFSTRRLPVGDVLAGTNSCTNQVKKTPICTHDFTKTGS